MKPKNRVFCRDCGRLKMLFGTEKKAMTFLKFNAEEMQENGHAPQRAYYCEACGGYHLTSSQKYTHKKSLTENIIDKYQSERARLKEIRAEESERKQKITKELRDLRNALDSDCIDNAMYEALRSQYDEICNGGVVPKARKLRRAIENRFEELCGNAKR